MPPTSAGVIDDHVEVSARPRLAVRRWSAASDGTGDDGRPWFLLVHGLASNARLWDGVAAALAALGHASVAVDLRGHGRSETPAGGYDTDTNADDVAALIEAEGLGADRPPVVVGQSWGGNVVLSLAARHPRLVAGVACVDGGWIRLQHAFASWAECWAVLAPPDFDDLTFAELRSIVRAAHPDWPRSGVEGTLANLVELPDGGVRARLAREHHRAIVRSLFDGDPRSWYPNVRVPALLVPALGAEPGPAENPRTVRARAAVRQALDGLPFADVRWYPGADHDLHAQWPERLAADLAGLARRVLQEKPR